MFEYLVASTDYLLIMILRVMGGVLLLITLH